MHLIKYQNYLPTLKAFLLQNNLMKHRAAIYRNKTRRMSSAVELSHRVIGYDPDETDYPPILIFHGLLGCKKNWQGIGKVLVKVTKRSVVTVDLRNHGWSPHTATHSYEEMALDILKLYTKLSISKASLIGHSMGGRTAMVVSLMEPAKVENLVIIDISPISNAKMLTDFFPKLLSVLKEISFKDYDTVPKARNEVKKKILHLVKDDITIGAILMNINKTKRGIGWVCNLDTLIKDFENIVHFPSDMRQKTFQGSTLFVGGQYSDFLPPDDLTGIRAMFPRSMVKYVPKAGHNVHVDATAAFLQLVLSFIRINE